MKKMALLFILFPLLSCAPKYKRINDIHEGIFLGYSEGSDKLLKLEVTRIDDLKEYDKANGLNVVKDSCGASRYKIDLYEMSNFNSKAKQYNFFNLREAKESKNGEYYWYIDDFSSTFKPVTSESHTTLYDDAYYDITYCNNDKESEFSVRLYTERKFNEMFSTTHIESGEIVFTELDPKAIVEKIDSYNGLNDKVEEFTPSEILNYSIEKFRSCDNCCSFTFGVADSIVRQDIRSCFVKNDDKCFEECISKSSMISVANRMYQDSENADVLLYSGNKETIEISDTSPQAEFSKTDLISYSSEEFENVYGRTISKMFNYMISANAILDSNIQKLDNTYIFDIELDVNISTNNYKKQMHNIGQLDADPKFQKVHLTFTLDNELMLQKLTVDEKYTARKVVDANVNEKLDIYYFPNHYVKIPQLDEPISYLREV